jgi:hypothetical protein
MFQRPRLRDFCADHAFNLSASGIYAARPGISRRFHF